jgi:hypothetical protein
MLCMSSTHDLQRFQSVFIGVYRKPIEDWVLVGNISPKLMAPIYYLLVWPMKVMEVPPLHIVTLDKNPTGKLGLIVREADVTNALGLIALHKISSTYCGTRAPISLVMGCEVLEAAAIVVVCSLELTSIKRG